MSTDSQLEEAKQFEEGQDSKEYINPEEEIEMEALKMHRVNSTGETTSSQLSQGESVFDKLARSHSAKVSGEQSSNDFGDTFIF